VPSLPDGWTSSTDSNSSQSAALKSLYRLGSSDSRKFLTVLNTEAPPHETADAFMSRASKAARQLLPHLLRKYQELVKAAASETEHEKFINAESEYDPFLEDTNNLTRDAYSGRAEIEPETPVKGRWVWQLCTRLTRPEGPNDLFSVPHFNGGFTKEPYGS
jgi:hypothetical protein